MQTIKRHLFGVILILAFTAYIYCFFFVNALISIVPPMNRYNAPVYPSNYTQTATFPSNYQVQPAGSLR